MSFSPFRTAVLAAFLTLGISVAGLHAQEIHAPEPPPDFNPATEPTVITVAKVMPAVVNIATERVFRRTEQDPFEQFFNQFFDDMTSNRRPREAQCSKRSPASARASWSTRTAASSPTSTSSNAPPT